MIASTVACVHATVALLKRMCREPLIIRSLVFPTAITLGTLVLTIGTVAWLRADPRVAISPALAAEGLDTTLSSEALTPVVSETPHAMLTRGEVWAAFDGETLWIAGGGPAALRLESIVRMHRRAPWRPDAEVPRPQLEQASLLGTRILVVLAALFALYGVVFGAGMIARDRDQGIFEVELSLAQPRWIHGASRWLAGTLALSAFLTLAIAMMGAVMGISDIGTTIRHGIACAAGSTSIGLLVIGRGGLRSGFTGPLAAGMTSTTSLFALGALQPELARWIPIASFLSTGDGWRALVGASVLGAFSVGVFTVRAARP